MVRFHTLLRCLRASHVIQWYRINWGEPVSSVYCVSTRYAVQPRKGRKAKEEQAVGWADSTHETVEIQWREAEAGLFLKALPCKVISKRKHYQYTGIGEIMATKLARISQLSSENPDMVFTSVGHLINQELGEPGHIAMVTVHRHKAARRGFKH